jgi:hypothetical protein
MTLNLTPSSAPAPDRIRVCTHKQFGDAGEHLVLAALALQADIPATKMPDNWPGYDLIAAPAGRPQVRISVKTNSQGPASGNVKFKAASEFDWLCIVLVDSATKQHRIWYLPRVKALSAAVQGPVQYIRYADLFGDLARFENNHALDPDGIEPRKAA